MDYKNRFERLQNDYEDLEKKHIEAHETINQLNQDISDKENIINNLKLDLNRKEEHLGEANKEIDLLNSELEKLKIDLATTNQELAKKTEKYSDLQDKYGELEQEYIDYKTKTTFELNNLRDFKQTNEALKSTHYEVKNHYEVLSMKYQSISDENFNLRRDLLLYEKECKNKSDTIDKLRNELAENRKREYQDERTNYNNNYEARGMYNSSSNYFHQQHSRSTSESNHYRSADYNEEKYEKRNESNGKAFEEESKVDPESRIKLLDSKLYNMNLEREKVKF
jgi:chromosome segregation ATPase